VQIHRRSRCTAGRALRRRRRCRRARFPMVYPGELHKPNRSPRRVSISFSVVSRRLLWLHRCDGGERSCPQGLSKNSPQGHVIIEFGFCDGSRSPLSHMAYFQAVQSRASRDAWKSASVRFDKNTRQAASKSARAWSWRWYRSDVRPDARPDRSRNPSPTDPRRAGCRYGLQSYRPAHRRNRCASILRERQSIGGG
jgi:hypothetical protein